MEEAKFTYSPLGKTLEKQTKTIEDQGEKQIKAIEEHEKQLVKSNALTEKYSLPLDKQKEILYKLVAERMETMEKLHNSIDFKKLIYHCKGPTASANFNDFIDATALDEIESNGIKLADEEKNQMVFKSKLSDIRIEGRKSDKQRSETENNVTLYDARDEVIKFYKDYSTMMNNPRY